MREVILSFKSKNMSQLILQTQIIDPSSDFHLQTKNVLIENGTITYIGDETLYADEIINAEGTVLSNGWFDFRASFRDPGDEHKEDLVSGSKAAVYGGFTDVALLPNTQPAIQHKEQIAYIKSKQTKLVNLHPYAFLSLNGKGEEMTEMYDLHHAGAVGFTDANKPIWHTGRMVKSLQYLQTFNGLLIQHAEELSLTAYGQMNEGKTSTYLGLKGIPKLAEELMVSRDIELLKYSGGRIHFSRVSSPKSLELIKNAKKQGLQVSCDVAVHHLIFTDKDVQTFDTNYKLNPPLRSKETQQALWKALSEDVIDVIVSDHAPQDEENKKLEFDQAAFGSSSIQTLVSVLNTAGKLPLEKLIQKITTAPRTLLNLPQLKIEVGANAVLTLFSPSIEWEFTKAENKSKSENSPYLGKKLKGKVVAVWNNGEFINIE